jgi:hypothetical protein
MAIRENHLFLEIPLPEECFEKADVVEEPSKRRRNTVNHNVDFDLDSHFADDDFWVV